MRHPQKLNIQTVYQSMSMTPITKHSVYFSSDGLAMTLGANFAFKHIIKPNVPYLVEEFRCGILMSGSAKATFNLQEHSIEAGSILFITPGSIMEIDSTSEDFQIIGLGLQEDLFRLVHIGHTPNLFNEPNKGGVIADVEITDFKNIKELFLQLWEIVHSENAPKETAAGLIYAITHYFDALYSKESRSEHSKYSRTYELFKKFLYLVSTNCNTNHHLDFYADKLCVSVHYLNAVVCQESGLSAKKWIDKAIIAKAQVLLRHSTKTISQITYELNFSTPSFFCKYFKRLTGLRPKEYRDEI